MEPTLRERVDSINAAVVKAQGDMLELAWALDRRGLSRDALNKLRTALADAAYESRQLMPGDVWPQ